MRRRYLRRHGAVDLKRFARLVTRLERTEGRYCNCRGCVHRRRVAAVHRAYRARGFR